MISYKNKVMVFLFKVEYVWIKNIYDLKQKIEWNVFV